MNYRRYPKRYSNYNPIKKDPNLLQRLEAVLGVARLDDRTRTFLVDLRRTCEKSGGLTQRQLECFVKIESRFSEAESAKFEEWKKEYLENHLEDTKVVARYYANVGQYYTKTANAVLSGEVISKCDWKKIMQNRYAERILDETKKPAKFNVNDMVQFRSTVGNSPGRDNRGEMRALRHRLAFVLQNDLPVTSAVAGGKRYCVLPTGYASPVILEERDIMKPNKRGKTS